VLACDIYFFLSLATNRVNTSIRLSLFYCVGVVFATAKIQALTYCVNQTVFVVGSARNIK